MNRRAYSLLEVVVVLVVASVLAGIAVVGYRTITSGAAVASASSALDRAVVIERTYSLTHGSYTADTAVLNTQSTDLVWVTGPADGVSDTGATRVSVAMSDGSVGLAVLDEEGICQARVVSPVSDDGAERVVTVTQCTGEAALG